MEVEAVALAEDVQAEVVHRERLVRLLLCDVGIADARPVDDVDRPDPST